jgi:hypothetical protein
VLINVATGQKCPEKSEKAVRNNAIFRRKKRRPFQSQGEKKGSFSKIFLVFQFWTFLKMSIFNSGPDFFFDLFKTIFINFSMQMGKKYGLKKDTEFVQVSLGKCRCLKWLKMC